MERRNFFKSLFAAGVVATIPKFNLENPEQIISEPVIKVTETETVTEQAISPSGNVIAKLYHEDKLIAYCGGDIKLSQERELIERHLSPLDPDFNLRPFGYREYINGGCTAKVDLEPVILVNKYQKESLLYDKLKLEIILQDGTKIAIDNCWVTELNSKISYEYGIEHAINLAVNGPIIIETTT